jgi:hypothetical protein
MIGKNFKPWNIRNEHHFGFKLLAQTRPENMTDLINQALEEFLKKPENEAAVREKLEKYGYK